MYQKGEQPSFEAGHKNPNRVSGGLRAQGVDQVTFISEDGSEQSVPTAKYVQSLEERIRHQHERIVALERLNKKYSQDFDRIQQKYTDQRLRIERIERHTSGKG